MSKLENIGYLEGESCNRNGCTGDILEEERRSCSCHIAPPCSACTEPRGYCDECGWRERDDGPPEMTDSDKKFIKLLRSINERPLDSTKIDYHNYGHTHFSMKKKGVYPEGTIREDIEVVVKGTFGGRFASFGNGHFEYIAYTD